MSNERNQSRMPIISDFHYGIVMKHADRLNKAIKHDRDYTYSYFGFKVYTELFFNNLIKCNIILIIHFRHLKSHIY